MVASLNATITTAMTVEQLRSHINGPQDLRGKTVGVLADSAAAMYLRVHGVTYKMYPSLDDAVAAPRSGKGAARQSNALSATPRSSGHSISIIRSFPSPNRARLRGILLRVRTADRQPAPHRSQCFPGSRGGKRSLAAKRPEIPRRGVSALVWIDFENPRFRDKEAGIYKPAAIADSPPVSPPT